jgi:hypothetical protein
VAVSQFLIVSIFYGVLKREFAFVHDLSITNGKIILIGISLLILALFSIDFGKKGRTDEAITAFEVKTSSWKTFWANLSAFFIIAPVLMFLFYF